MAQTKFKKWTARMTDGTVIELQQTDYVYCYPRFETHGVLLIGVPPGSTEKTSVFIPYRQLINLVEKDTF